MRYFRFLLLGVCALLYLAGCGSSPEQPKTSQLVGKWVHTNPADMLGLEFTKDGKAMLYYGGGNEAMAADYTILGDGRLSLGLGGQNSYYVPALLGDKLQLKEAVTGNVMEYRRLGSGETIASAIAAQDQADKKAVQERYAAIPNFITRRDLVMVISGNDPHAPAPCALELAPAANGFAGRAVYDGKPLHVDNVSAQIRGTETPALQVLFGVTANNPNGALQITFHPAGTAPNISLTAPVNFGEMFNTAPNSTATIKVDAALHQQILDHVKAEAVRLEALKAPVAALLKDYAVLKGTAQSSLPSEREGFTNQFTLARNAENNTWVGQGQLVNRATGATEIFPAVAVVGIVSDKPVLQILSQKRMYQFGSIDTAAGKLGGAWQMRNYPNSSPAELTIAQAIDAKERDQFFAASKAALLGLGSGAVYHALLNDQSTNGTQPPNPIAVTLTAASGGTITGRVEYPLQGCTMNLAGKEVDTPLGPQLQLQYTGGQANPGAWGDVGGLINLVQHEAWLLSPSGDASGPMRLTGYAVTNPTQGAMPNTLQLIPYGEKDKAAIAQALAAGVSFELINPRMGSNVAHDVLAFTGDAATGKVTGQLTTAGYQINNSKGSTFTGEIKDQGGWAELAAPIMRPVDRKAVYAYTVVFTPTDGGLYMSGYCYNIQMGPTRPLGRFDALQTKP